MIFREGKLTYNSKTGAIWRTRRDYSYRLYALTNEGYLMVKVDYKEWRAARWIWKLVTGKEAEGVVTYRNGDKTDLRFANLYVTTQGELVRNTLRGMANRNSRTGIRGVVLSPDHRDRFRAYARPAEGGRKYLGTFYSLKAAKEAVENAERTNA